jgi:rhamnosyltransferase
MSRKSKESVCILLATYNGHAWLVEQITSILNQTHTNLDIYISDDLSFDGSTQIIEQYITQHKNIFFLPHQGKFGSAARNFFRLIREVDLSKYSYIAFADQDDIWEPDKINLAIHSLKHRNTDGYSSNIVAFWEEGKRKLINKAQPQTKYDYMFESAGPGCTFVISKKVALELQKLIRQTREKIDGITLHDWFIYAFARSRGYKWYIDPTPTLNYRQHADNVVGANSGFKAMRARFSKLNEGWYLQQILLIAKSLGYEHASALTKIMRLNVFDRLYLATFSYQYRRRLRDRLAFAFFILFLARKP